MNRDDVCARLAFADAGPWRSATAMSLHIGPSDAVVTYGELHALVASASEELRSAGCRADDRVVLLLPQGHAAVALFFAAIYLGAVPCIIAWPTAKMDPDKYRRNLHGVVAGLRAEWLVTEHAMADDIGQALGRTHVIDVDMFDDALDLSTAPMRAGGPLSPAMLGHGDPLFIQFSGGTTGTQKSVPISISKLHRQLAAYAERLLLREDDRVISWLPLYHDMGLVACTLLPFIHRLAVSLFSPMEWVMDPSRFIAAIGADRASLCWLPNFAFRFMAQKARWRDEAVPDLSSLRAVINCSEPVRRESMQAFFDRFSSFGLRRDALHCCYAMAEATFAVTQTTDADPPREIQVRRDALGTGRLILSEDGDRWLVSCGSPIADIFVKIVDDIGNECQEGHVGEILLRGAFVMDDYLRSDDRPARWAFTEDGWYASGDLGALWDEHLYVTGRKKDLIIVRGINVYPEDLETAIGEIHGIHAGRVVALGIEAPERDTENLVIVAEVDDVRDFERAEELQLEARRAVLTVAGLAPSEVFIVSPRWIVKSTAGKISRTETRDRVIQRWLELTGEARKPDEETTHE